MGNTARYVTALNLDIRDLTATDVVSVANTGGLYTMANTSIFYNVSSTILNPATIWQTPTALPITGWTSTNMTTATGNLLISAAAGNHHELFHISCNNAGATDSEFFLVNSLGGVLRRYYLAKSGGIVAEQFNPPVALSTTGNIYYTGAAAGDINIALHYRTVAN